MIDLKKSAVVLALALAMVACATVVVDESDAEIRTSDSGFTYTTSQKIASITGYTGNDEVIVIPETIDSYPVQAINDRAFQNLSIKEVYIPASVTSIGEYAFLSCTNLQYVTICGSATIGLSAFDGCNAMKLIDIQIDASQNCGILDCFSLKLSKFDLAVTIRIHFGECCRNDLLELFCRNLDAAVGFNTCNENLSQFGRVNFAVSIDVINCKTKLRLVLYRCAL